MSCGTSVTAWPSCIWARSSRWRKRTRSSTDRAIPTPALFFRPYSRPIPPGARPRRASRGNCRIPCAPRLAAAFRHAAPGSNLPVRLRHRRSCRWARATRPDAVASTKSSEGRGAEANKEFVMTFFDMTPESEASGSKLVAWTRDRMAGDGLDPAAFALTLLSFSRPLTPQDAAERPAGFAHNGDRPFYPCSVVKVFYLAAAQARLEEGRLTPHAELDRAIRDMIRWSSNTATNYIIDLVTETTGDTLLGKAELPDWVHRRQWVNRYFRSLAWPEAGAINVCQKLMDDDRYGREKVFVAMSGNNHNRLTTNAVARLFHAIFTGRIVSPQRSLAMAEMLARPLDDPAFVAHPLSQIRGYFAAGLPAGARIWSKAGLTVWTGDRDASYRRHDAAYIVLPSGRALILAVFTEGRAASESEKILPAIAGKAAELAA